jgi:hypothetical protein
VCVDHGHFHVAVTKQSLNGPDIGSALKQVGGGGMTKGVCADRLCKTRAAATDIRPLFRQRDIKAMKSNEIDLFSYQDVEKRAQNIYVRLSAKEMPCDEPWIDSGCSKSSRSGMEPRFLSKEPSITSPFPPEGAKLKLPFQPLEFQGEKNLSLFLLFSGMGDRNCGGDTS